MSNMAIEETKKLLALGDRKTDDIKEVLAAYEKAHKLNKEYAADISKLKESISVDFKAITDELAAAQDNYKKLITSSTEKISDSMKEISDNVDLSPVKDKVAKEIAKVLKESSIEDFKKILDGFEETYFSLLENMDKLKGTADRKGIFQDINDEIENLESKLLSMKKSFNWFGYFQSGLLGLLLGAGFIYFYLEESYDKRLNDNIINQSIKLHEVYRSKLDSMREENRAYLKFKKINSIDKNSGFGFFDDSNEPYFYYE